MCGAILILACAVSCNRNDAEISPGEVFKSVGVKVADDNALRMEVAIEFKKSVTYEIEYWKEEEPAMCFRTRSREAAGAETAELILLEPDTRYLFRIHARCGGGSSTTDTYAFRSGMLPGNIPEYALSKDELTDEPEGYILMCKRDEPGFITLCDMRGTIVWYESVPEGVRVATYDDATGTILAIVGSSPLKSYAGTGILMLDLAGNRLLEKNIVEMHPHHDIRRMPDGNIIMVNYVPKTFDLSACGGSSEETVWGDGYSILDPQGNVLESWDCYGELDPREDPDIMKKKGDWLHANAVNYDREGNRYMTFNKISQLWRIDPDDGHVLYRVGADGNVDIDERFIPDGLHSPYPLDPDRVLVLDNGKSGGEKVTRALIYEIDPETMSATATLEVPLPAEYGSQNRSNACFIDDNLMLFGSSGAKAAIFTDLEGNVLYPVSVRQMLDGKNFFSGFLIVPDIVVGKGTSNHHGDKLVLVGLLYHLGSHILAVPHDGDPVTDLLQLAHLVGNIDDANALLCQIPHDAKQIFDLLVTDGGGGLVHNQDL